MYYKYKENTYFVIRECTMKNPETGKWQEAVMYSPTNHDPQAGITPIYIREKSDFYQKFQKHE